MELRWVRTTIFLLFLILTLGDVGIAQIRISSFVSSSSTSSAISGAVEQPNLFCRGGRCQTAQAWQRQELEDRARQKGQLRQMEQLNHGCDGNCIVIDNSSTDWDQPQSNSSGYKTINLNTQMNLRDTSPNISIRVDTSSSSGQRLSQEVASSIAIAVPQILNFVERQQYMDQVRQQFQQHYQAASQAGRQYVEELRSYSKALREQAQATRQSTLMQANLVLNSLPLANRTREEREAAEEAKKISNSALRNTKYEMSSSGAEMLDEALERAVANGDWEEAARLVESLTYGKVNGSRINSSALNSHSNGDGVIKVDGPFDSHQFETPLDSNDGQVVRRLANRYQTLWQQSNSLEIFSDAEVARFAAGVIALSAGDSALASGDLGSGAGLLRASEIISQSFTGLAVGFGESLNDLVQAVPELGHLAKTAYADPSAAWTATMNFALNLDVVAGVMINGLIADGGLLANGSAYDRGRIVGRYAIDIISIIGSGGALAANKGLATTSKGIKVLAKESKLFRRISHAIPPKAMIETEKAALRLDEIATKMNASAKSGLKFHIERDPKLAQAITTGYHKALKQGRTATAKYLERIAASKQPLTRSVDEIAEFHHNLRPSMAKAPSASREGLFSRAIPSEGVIAGKKVKFSKENVFQDHPGLVTNEHRFTIGGEFGHRGLYMVEGSADKAKHVLSAETRTPVGNLISDEKQIKVNGILDLTKGETRNILKLDQKDFSGLDYDYSQAIGDVAIEHGFSGIVFESTQVAGAINVVLFK